MGANSHSVRDLGDLLPFPLYSQVEFLDPKRPDWEPSFAGCFPTRDHQVTDSYRTHGQDVAPETQAEMLQLTRNGFLPNPAYDTGHSFFTEKSTARLSPRVTIYDKDGWGDYGNRTKSFGYVTNFSHITPVSNGHMSLSDQRYYGAQAIEFCNPLRPDAQLATFASEFAQAAPSAVGMALLQERTKVFRALGSEHLNVQFGWLPFYSDLEKLVKSLRNRSQTVSQMKRDSGKVVRRGYSWPLETESTHSEGITSYSRLGLGSAYFRAGTATSIPYSVDTVVQKRRWFRGAFQYYIPSSDGVLDRLQAYEALANKVLGQRMTPETLWNLAPWSWLTDWFGDIGSVISNTVALGSDGLVMRYGYLMLETTHLTTLRTSPTWVSGGKQTLTQTLRTVTKERVRATPFGFALDPSVDISSTQWSVLVALGFTR